MGLTIAVLAICVDVPPGYRFTAAEQQRRREIATDLVLPRLELGRTASDEDPESMAGPEDEDAFRAGLELWHRVHVRTLQRAVDIWADVCLPQFEAHWRHDAVTSADLEGAQHACRTRFALELEGALEATLGALYTRAYHRLFDRSWLKPDAEKAVRRALTLADIPVSVDTISSLLNEAMAQGMGNYLVAGEDGTPEPYQLGLNHLARTKLVVDWHNRRRPDGTSGWGPGAAQLPVGYEPTDVAPGPAEAVVAADREDAVRAALAKVTALRPRDAAWAAAAKYVRVNPGGRRCESYEQIAAEFGVTRSRVRTRVPKIRAALHDELARHDPGPLNPGESGEISEIPAE